MSKPEEEPCWARQATPLEAAFAFRTGVNQRENYGDIGGLLLGEFNLGQTGACGIDWFGTGQKKGGTGVDCSPAGVSGLESRRWGW